jgi:uncharacterized protein
LADRNNGAVLFVFVQDRRMYLQVGYGLEGVLPDATCKGIIDDVITPRFRAGNFTGGLSAGVQAILSAVRGEYQGTGRTVADSRVARRGKFGVGAVFGVALLVIVFVLFLRGGRVRRGYSAWGGRRGWVVGGGGWHNAGGGWGGGGGWSGGGGTFSGQEADGSHEDHGLYSSRPRGRSLGGDSRR